MRQSFDSRFVYLLPDVFFDLSCSLLSAVFFHNMNPDLSSDIIVPGILVYECPLLRLRSRWRHLGWLDDTGRLSSLECPPRTFNGWINDDLRMEGDDSLK